MIITIKTCTISRTASGAWEVSFSYEVDTEALAQTTGAIGIDEGLEQFAALSNGQKMDNSRFFKRKDKHL